jgi:hypothetical protein
MKKILLALTLLPIMSLAQAECLPSDITGNWISYQTNITATIAHTGRCDLKIADNNNRSLTGTCSLSNGYEMTVTGKAKVNSDCSASLTLNFTGGSMNFEMQLSTDRQAFVGRWENSYNEVGATNGVRK